MHCNFVKWGVAPAWLALLMMTQLHWAALQMIAWGGMVVSYSARSGIEAGIRETFDGKHPCPMCMAIKAAKERENPSTHLDVVSSDTRLETVPLLPSGCPVPDRIGCDLSGGNFNFAGPPDERPPVPPPRARNA